MKTIIFYSELIRSIRRVYCRISLIILHNRVLDYHDKPRKNTVTYVNDIRSPLLDIISDIIENQVNAPAIPALMPGDTPHDFHIQYRHNNLHPHNQKFENTGELSKYFKERRNGEKMHDGIKDKLEQSTLEHVNSALRFARQADARNAKMHVDIASCSCKELSHYMTKDEHLEFIAGIQKDFDVRLNNCQKQQ